MNSSEQKRPWVNCPLCGGTDRLLDWGTSKGPCYCYEGGYRYYEQIAWFRNNDMLMPPKVSGRTEGKSRMFLALSKLIQKKKLDILDRDVLELVSLIIGTEHDNG